MEYTLKGAAALSLAAAVSLSVSPYAFASESQPNNLLDIWYKQPAQDWQTEALAIGNGYMGALVFGGVGKDKIHLNEKTVWRGGPGSTEHYNYGNTNKVDTEEDLQKVRDDLNYIRQKLEDKSKYVFGYAAESYIAQGTETSGEAMDDLNKLMGDLAGYDAPQDYANLYLTTYGIDESLVKDYVRSLDLTTGVASVSYEYNGVKFKREYLNSYPDNVLAIRLTADKDGEIDFTANLEDVTGGSVSYFVKDNTITMRTKLKDNGLNAETQVKILIDGGNIFKNANALKIQDANSATILLATGTDYKMVMPSFRGEDPHNAIATRLAAAESKGYDAIKKDHIADHSALFSRMSLNFNEEVPTIPTDELIKKYRNLVEKNGGEVPTDAEQRALEVICYQFGRYLTIAGSREGALPTNLQGVWGEGEFEWWGDYHFNINVQMNYWPTMASNLAECHKPYNELLNHLRVAGRQAAGAAFGIKSTEQDQNGWLVGCFSTPYLYATMGQDNNAAGWNPIGSAWALLNSYEYYLFSGDEEYLKNELYPSMKEVAKFWDKALFWSESQKRFVSAPSYSPENGPIVNGASYDQQFIYQHFANTIAAAEHLGVDADLVKVWKEKMSKLEPVIVGADGQVKEWFEETHIGKAQAGNLPESAIPQWRQSLGAQVSGEQPPHRHLSHLMALYPCNIISKDNPKFMDAAIVTLNERGLDATGWSKAHKLNLWARTGNAENAFSLVQSAVGGGNSGFLTNLFSSHGAGANYKEKPIFQIDGNFGYTAGVNEMLMQSQLGYVQFLPALPKQWNTGYVKGMVARGNFEIDMYWTEGQGNLFKVKSRNGGEFTAEYKDLASFKVTDEAGKSVSVKKISNDKISFNTEKGHIYNILQDL